MRMRRCVGEDLRQSEVFHVAGFRAKVEIGQQYRVMHRQPPYAAIGMDPTLGVEYDISTGYHLSFKDLVKISRVIKGD